MTDNELKKYTVDFMNNETGSNRSNLNSVMGKMLIRYAEIFQNHIVELEAQNKKMKRYIKACWVEENINDYSSYITNTSDEFRDLVEELNAEVRNGR